ncbi:MAG: cytochrome c biogenesis protein CcdA [Spirochaetales bacterium]|uniref:Cytochrome c biogenesis protein CcdA n=1 Tax=Candidatus Thalassospirochaeta sargassi TaxID=3119039 RepID=A0AAJ1ID50_9SPIO|nr:cytochrome c biogenesis protein CcdA [Spirochaetales bacterium]
MMDFFNLLNTGMSQPGLFAFAAALLWGILSVIISPCHLGSLPLIIAYINNREKPDTKTAFTLSLLFGLGLLIMLAVIGIITSMTGRIMGDIGDGVLIGVAIFLIICGIWLMDFIPLSKTSFSFTPKRIKAGKFGSFILGLVYGIALGPCSFAFMAPMLGFVFSASASTITFGFSLMLFYAVGHTAVIIAAGTFGDAVNNLLQKKWTDKALPVFKKICGIAVVAVGIYQLIDLI